MAQRNTGPFLKADTWGEEKNREKVSSLDERLGINKGKVPSHKQGYLVVISYLIIYYFDMKLCLGVLLQSVHT